MQVIFFLAFQYTHRTPLLGKLVSALANRKGDLQLAGGNLCRAKQAPKTKTLKHLSKCLKGSDISTNPKG